MSDELKSCSHTDDPQPTTCVVCAYHMGILAGLVEAGAPATLDEIKVRLRAFAASRRPTAVPTHRAGHE